MKAVEFCYWLQGFFEITEAGLNGEFPYVLDADQVAMIKKHLALVFVHDIDPSYPKEQQGLLNTIHESVKTNPEFPQKFRC